jgi:hypothetical protein
MPKQILEMKLFNAGTITTPDSTDIAPEAASYSLNLDSVTENGKLKGVPTDTSISITDNAHNIESTNAALIINTRQEGNGISSVTIDGMQLMVLKTSIGWKIVDG